MRQVAAHLTMQQQTFGDLLGFIAHHPRMLRSVTLNATIHDSAVLRAGGWTTSQLVNEIRAGIGSRRHNAFVTPLETLSDILVHSQDIAVPLGREIPVPPEAAAEAATRVWPSLKKRVGSVFHPVPWKGFRFIATDIGWSAGEGAEVRGPMLAILLLLTGRQVALSQLEGDGVAALRRSMDGARRPVT